MLDRIIRFTLSHASFVAIAAALLIIIGVWSYLTIPVDAFPDVTNKQVEIVSRRDGLSAVELERTVTVPLENAMRGIPGVKSIRSVTKYGIAILTIVCEENVNLQVTRQMVFERLVIVRESLPDGVDTELSPMVTVMGEIFQYSVVMPAASGKEARLTQLADLRSLQDWVIAPRLKAVAGVSEVNSYGGFIREYHVTLDPALLAKYEVRPGEVTRALETHNRIVTGGIIERFGTKSVIRGLGRFTSLTDIEDVTIARRERRSIKVRDVATVAVGHGVRQGAALENGEESVGGIVMMLRGENGRAVVRRVKKAVDAINAGNILPEGVSIVPYYDRSTIVNSSINTVTRALLEGAFFSIIVLAIFLRSFRSTIVVIVSLPLNLLVTFALMRLIGLEANIMSLGGMIISLGMIVDAAVIQVENIQRRLAGGHTASLTETIALAIMEVRKPSIFGEIIIASTFIPLLAFQGIEGRMFLPLALTVICMLAVSLFLSIFVMPALCHLLLAKSAHGRNAFLERLQMLYAKVLDAAMKRTRAIVAAAIGLTLAAFILIPFLGSEFVPVMDEGAFDMDVTLHPSVSLDHAIDVNRAVSGVFRSFPEISNAVGRIGQTGMALDVRGVDRTGYVGLLAPRSRWTNARNREGLFEKLRQELKDIPGVSLGFSQPIQCRIDEIVAGTRSQLVVRVYGDDMGTLAALSARIGAALRGIRGAADIAVERSQGQRYLAIAADRPALSQFGLSVADIQETIEHASGGVRATRVSEGERTYDLMVRYPEEYRSSRDELMRLIVVNDEGRRIPLGDVASIEWEEGPLQISRENGGRRMGVELNVVGRDIGGFVAEARRTLAKKVPIPRGYHLEWGGQFENQIRAMRTLALIAPIVLAIIAGLLFITFRSLRNTALIVANLPFSLAGGVVALKLSGQYLSVPAAIGFIVLFGIAVLNGMVLVSCIAQLRESGLSAIDAVRKGTQQRMRPVLMTALIAIASLLPLLMAHGTGSEIQRPLAAVVVGGVLTATLGTLFLLPAGYCFISQIAVPKINRRKPAK